jgi:hypothetical protein
MSVDPNVPSTTVAAALKAIENEGSLTAHEATFGTAARLEAARQILGQELYVREICKVNRARYGFSYACICGHHRHMVSPTDTRD